MQIASSGARWQSSVVAWLSKARKEISGGSDGGGGGGDAAWFFAVVVMRWCHAMPCRVRGWYALHGCHMVSSTSAVFPCRSPSRKQKN